MTGPDNTLALFTLDRGQSYVYEEIKSMETGVRVVCVTV